MEQQAFEQLVDDDRRQTDLADLIGADIKLVRCGSVLKGRSLVHSDSEPSLVVWPATQTWRDYSGGGSGGGDCYEYVMYRDRISFGEALRLLAERCGLQVPGTQPSPELAERRELEQVLTAAAAYYHRVLPPEIRQKW